METISHTEKISPKDFFYNVFSNVFQFAELDEKWLHSYFLVSHKRRRSFCCRVASLSINDFKLTDNPEIYHLLQRAEKYKLNTKHNLDRWFVACLTLTISATVLMILIPNNPFRGLFILIPLLVLFLKCLKIELCTKKYVEIIKCLQRLLKSQENTKRSNDCRNEISQIADNNMIIRSSKILLISNNSENIEKNYKKHEYQLLSLLKVIDDNTNIEMDNSLIELFNNSSFIKKNDLSFSVKDTTRFLAILEKKGLLKFNRGDQKKVSKLIVSNFKINGKEINLRTYYNSLNDTMSVAVNSIRDKASTVIIDAINNFLKK